MLKILPVIRENVNEIAKDVETHPDNIEAMYLQDLADGGKRFFIQADDLFMFVQEYDLKKLLNALIRFKEL